MNREELQQLSKKFINGAASAEEKDRLHNWYAAQLDELEEFVFTAFPEDREKVKNRLFESISAKTITVMPLERKVFGLWPRIAIAVAVTCMVIGVYFFNTRIKDNNRATVPTTYVNDIKPGHNGATLTLATGEILNLSRSKSGVVIEDSKIKYNDGTVVARGSQELSSIGMMASTSKGQTYQVVLPDGSMVWLNAASSIKFPSRFSQARRIELIGEAYFEVVHDEKHPFIVKTENQEITVLGTHFNINSYTNEPAIKTTLLEGSVRVTGSAAGLESIILRPGEQSVNTGKKIHVNQADIELAVAWKNNKFMFRKYKIQDIMRMIERWYNVEVMYEGEIPDDLLGGSVSRFDNISKVLNILELTGNVHFKIEGRRVTVTK